MKNIATIVLLTALVINLSIQDNPSGETKRKIEYENYHGAVYHQEGSRKMSRLNVMLSQDYEEDKMTIKRIVFSRLNEIELSPSYEIVAMSTKGYDLSKDGKGFLSGNVMIKKSLSNFPYEKEIKYGRLINVSWKAGSGKMPESFDIKITDHDTLVLNGFYKVNLPLGNMLNTIITGVIFLVLLVAFIQLWRQRNYYDSLFIYLAPKLTIVYMMIGDLLLFIH
jgi:hypothetical protein